LDIPAARDHQHVAIFGEIVRLELGHAVDVGFCGKRIGALSDVAHGERRADDQLAGQGRFQHRRADHAFGHAELVHHVREQAGAFAERQVPLHRARGRLRRRLHFDALGRDPAGEFLVGHDVSFAGL
jgi:hypothetical protein